MLRTLEVNTFTFRYATGKGGKFSRDLDTLRVARMVKKLTFSLGPPVLPQLVQ